MGQSTKGHPMGGGFRGSDNIVTRLVAATTLGPKDQFVLLGADGVGALTVTLAPPSTCPIGQVVVLCCAETPTGAWTISEATGRIAVSLATLDADEDTACYMNFGEFWGLIFSSIA